MNTPSLLSSLPFRVFAQLANGLTVIFALVGISGCVSVPQDPRLDVELNGLRSNQTTNSNFEYPIFVQYSGSRLILLVEGYTESPTRFMVEKSNAPDFINAIDKYLEWEPLATARGDQITKKISSISYYGSNLVFRFHSANKGTHLFIAGIRTKMLGDDVAVDGVSDLQLDKANVERLRKIITDFQNGALHPVNTDQIYK